MSFEMCTNAGPSPSWSNEFVFKITDCRLKNIASFFIRPILEEQALLREKLKTMPTWKKDKDPAMKRKTQPMVSEMIIYRLRPCVFSLEYWPF